MCGIPVITNFRKEKVRFYVVAIDTTLVTRNQYFSEEHMYIGKKRFVFVKTQKELDSDLQDMGELLRDVAPPPGISVPNAIITVI